MICFSRLEAGAAALDLRAGRVSPPLPLGPRTEKEWGNSLRVVDMEEYWAGVDVRSWQEGKLVWKKASRKQQQCNGRGAVLQNFISRVPQASSKLWWFSPFPPFPHVSASHQLLMYSWQKIMSGKQFILVVICAFVLKEELLRSPEIQTCASDLFGSESFYLEFSIIVILQ